MCFMENKNSYSNQEAEFTFKDDNTNSKGKFCVNEF